MGKTKEEVEEKIFAGGMHEGSNLFGRNGTMFCRGLGRGRGKKGRLLGGIWQRG
jgi:hypothetical protein